VETFSRTTTPVGVPLPDVTEHVTLTLASTVKDVGVSVKFVVVAVRVGEAQPASKFATLIEPNPVARS
jgi:hypothetical protein